MSEWRLCRPDTVSGGVGGCEAVPGVDCMCEGAKEQMLIHQQCKVSRYYNHDLVLHCLYAVHSSCYACKVYIASMLV